MTGGVKGGDVIAVVIGILLCSCGNGSGSVMDSGRDTSHVDMRCQRRFWTVAQQELCRRALSPLSPGLSR
jgi:hypothetical protein